MEYDLESLIAKCQCIFETSGSHTANYARVAIHIKTGSQPGYLRARHFLLALRDKVIEELNDMIHRGTLLKVETLYWGSPIVNLLEPDGKIHICELYSNDISSN
uniref:Putative LOC100904270 [Metaseiulus occidentalis] n=1 Tax=Lepeophtheirus salmonis TaxID=72036 RepID=A0A0K2T2S6_LEPSM